MVGSSQKGLVLQPRCHERNLSVEKKYSLNTSDIYFVLALHKPSLPTLGWEVRACVCAFRGNPAAQALVGLL